VGGMIIFDGVCNFCDSSVKFIIKYDQVAYFQFAPMQSDAGQALLAQYEVPDNMDSVILIEHGKVYFESTAALKICRRLDSFWPVCYIFIMIPPIIRNKMYRLFAKNRYRLFGRKESCLLPTRSQRKRFL